MRKVKVKLLSSKASIPTRGSIGSAGLDFYTPIDVIIPPWTDQLIPLDIAIELPIETVMIIKEKSGLAWNKKLICGASVIDSDYRGNIHAHLFNLSDIVVSFKEKEKICQGLILNYYNKEIHIVQELSNTQRGEGGFGSTN